MPAVWPDSADPADAALNRTELREEAGDFLAPKSPVTPGGDAVCSYSSVAAPPPQRVRMDMKESGHFPDGQQFIHMFAISHIYSDLLFHQLILSVTYFS